jgi:hypothetical protein
VQKYFLFRADSEFYTVETLEFLREAAERANDSSAVQGNFLEFLRLLTYGLSDTLGVVTHGKSNFWLRIARSSASRGKVLPRGSYNRVPLGRLSRVERF